MISETLGRHLLKASAVGTTFVAIQAGTAIALVYFSRWFLKSEGVPIKPGASSWEVVARSFIHLGRRKRLAVMSVGLLCLVSRAALIPILKVPAPKDHDEFSYLLAGDTFARGRLTNPTPPMWVHFESIHINLRPTYMSMYPPGQGMVLALGQWLGHPWIGVLLTAALGCALICWMLQAWLPPAWALLGGVLAVLQFGLLSYWTNTYYCTWLPAIGGALVLGAWPRLRKRPRVSQAVLLGLGVAFLALSRPYEGLFFSLPIAGAILVWLFGSNRPNLRIGIPRVVAPLLLVMVLLAAFLGYYNWRVSGNALIMPYQLNQKTYAGVPLFPWQHERTKPVYHNAEMRRYYADWAVSGYRRATARGAIYMGWMKLRNYWRFYFGFFLTIPLLALPWLLRDKRVRFLLVVIVVTGLGLELELWSHPHYAAPLTCALMAIVLQGMRHLRVWQWRGMAAGRILVGALVVGLFAFDAAWVSAAAAHVNAAWLYPVGNQQRAAIQMKLEQLPGSQVVIVHYSPSHQVFREWVYNRADIERAKVVWARDLGPACNAELIRYFKDRQFWLVQPDLHPPQLSAYSATPASIAADESTADCDSSNPVAGRSNP